MSDVLRLQDNVETNDAFGVKGHVKIYNLSTHEKLVDKSNHIVLCGRHWLMQRMFNLPFSMEEQQHSYTPAWFSLGQGGAALDTPFQPIWPTDEDVNLFDQIVFNSTGGSRYSDDRKYKLIDGIEWSAYLTAKVTMTLTEEDAADKYINEAGIFVSPTQVSNETKHIMFSHVTFPTLPKSNLEKLLIEWYFIF